MKTSSHGIAAPASPRLVTTKGIRHRTEFLERKSEQ